MTKHYIFFTRNVLPQPNVASLVWAAHSANAAANLGYSAVLVYPSKDIKVLNPVDLIFPFRPRTPEKTLVEFYNIQDKLKVAPLPLPWPVDRFGGKLTSSSTIICKYYFPIHILPHTKIVHTRDWNFTKVAIQHKVPVIYEHHHYDSKQFEPEIVHSPFFQVAVTLSETVRENMIQHGMPSEKIIKLHSGLNNLFLIRKPEEAEAWRQKLLVEDRHHIVVYSGGLYPFKGVDLLIDVAEKLPQIQFALAGGTEPQVQAYQQMARKKQVNNVTFLGYLPQNQLASLLQAADILAHPHRFTEAATFTSPLKFFDYIASGTPIAATEIPPLIEFKSSNIIAGWCEPDNPLKFAECLKQVLETYPRRTEGYTKNIEFAHQFSCENRIAKIMNYVDDSMRPLLFA
ncbi:MULTISPECIES: glycosyltransferase [Cyanophyceae]|uniref:glycosyltransferase n=1 Tax=Cyanophyceae TaxID=3028117 RepID=UPI001688260E|nr:glycosyltransferase [Trichocoleus sp. FACHB-69]MBD1934717.1 glycosyltransferase [Trichocoleus sp. FACHB-69]